MISSMMAVIIREFPEDLARNVKCLGETTRRAIDAGACRLFSGIMNSQPKKRRLGPFTLPNILTYGRVAAVPIVTVPVTSLVQQNQ